MIHIEACWVLLCGGCHCELRVVTSEGPVSSFSLQRNKGSCLSPVWWSPDLWIHRTAYLSQNSDIGNKTITSGPVAKERKCITRSLPLTPLCSLENIKFDYHVSLHRQVIAKGAILDYDIWAKQSLKSLLTSATLSRKRQWPGRPGEDWSMKLAC